MTDINTTPLVTDTNVSHLVTLALVVSALVVVYLGLTLISNELSQLHHLA